MKTLKIFIYSIISVVVICLIVIYFIVNGISKGALPQYEGELTIPGLNNEVTVYFDERGMPHIYATGEHDLYLATGYIMAQERLWQMDLIRRATTGRLSEIFGSDYIQTDLFLRSLKMSEKSEKIINITDKEILDCVDWFVEGVNSYIEKAGDNLPPEFRILRYKPEPWSRIYGVNIIGYMGWDLASGNLSGDLFMYKLMEEFGEHGASMLIPFFDYDGETVYPGFNFEKELTASADDFITAMAKTAELGLTSFMGSNNWALNGDHTETGKPILSNDMHLGLSSPGIWMQMHQVIPGKLNVTGVFVPGQPFVIAGHNDSIAWGMTNLMVDDIDLYVETTNEDRTKYRVDGQWRDIVTEKEVIISGDEETELEIKYTHRGPIISGFRNIEEADLSMRWSGYDLSNELTAVYLLNRAADWNDFNNAISHFNAISQNFGYADVAGNIGLHTGGGVAVREGYGAFIMPGDTSLFDWKGYVPHERLPFSYNPESGMVSSANNKTVDFNYPYYIGTYYAMPYRINRIREMLTEKATYNIDDFKRMITDRHSDFAKKLVPLLIKAYDGVEEISDQEKIVLAGFIGWNYNMSRDLSQPTVFEFFRKYMVTNLLKDELGDLFEMSHGAVKDYYIYRIITEGGELFVDDIRTEEVEDLNMIIRKSFKESIDELTDLYGDDESDWMWGDIHKFEAEHPMSSVKVLDRLFGLNGYPYRVGGSNHTVSPYVYSSGFKVNNGASERHIYNTANWDESYTIIPTGNSGVPASEFYLSQTELYCNDGFYTDHFSHSTVENGAKYVLVLKPE